MPPKQHSIVKEAFDSIVFLGFVALLSIAATKANSWEREMCGPKPLTKKTTVMTDATQPTFIRSSRSNANPVTVND